LPFDRCIIVTELFDLIQHQAIPATNFIAFAIAAPSTKSRSPRQRCQNGQDEIVKHRVSMAKSEGAAGKSRFSQLHLMPLDGVEVCVRNKGDDVAAHGK